MTHPVRPAEPAEPTTLVFSRVLTVDEARQVRDLLIRFSDVQDELAAARVEAASLREQLDDLYRVWRRDRGAWRARLSAVEGERDELTGALEGAREALQSSVATENAAEVRVSELQGLLDGLGRSLEGGLDWTAPDGSRMRHPVLIGKHVLAWLAAHPLKTEGDGVTPTTETKGQP